MVVVLEHVKKFLNEVMAFYHTLWILVATSLPGLGYSDKVKHYGADSSSVLILKNRAC